MNSVGLKCARSGRSDLNIAEEKETRWSPFLLPLRVRYWPIAEVGLRPGRYALPTSVIEIEVTEEVLQDNRINIANELSSLHEMGITIHIDDFGTGYSSLPQLHRFHTKFLKIDEGFMAQLGRTNNGEVFFRAII